MDLRLIPLLSVLVLIISAVLYDDGNYEMYKKVEKKATNSAELKTDDYIRTTEWVSYDKLGGRLEAWVYRPTKPYITPTPVVVMANALGLTKDAGLETYVKTITSQGLAVVTFDHRNFGGSDGYPRHHIKISDQVADWEKVLLHVTNNVTGIDNKKIAVWGASFESGNALAVASTSVANLKKQNVTISALVLSAPIVDGFKLILDYHWNQISSKYFTGLLLGIKDLVYSFFGVNRYIPIAAAPTEEGLSPIQDKNYNDYLKLVPTNPNGGWANQITASSMFQIILTRPGLYASSVEIPTLIVLAKKDNYVTPSTVKSLAESIPKSELVEFDVNSFDLLHEKNIALAQVVFIKKAVA